MGSSIQKLFMETVGKEKEANRAAASFEILIPLIYLNFCGLYH